MESTFNFFTLGKGVAPIAKYGNLYADRKIWVAIIDLSSINTHSVHYPLYYIDQKVTLQKDWDGYNLQFFLPELLRLQNLGFGYAFLPVIEDVTKEGRLVVHSVATVPKDTSTGYLLASITFDWVRLPTIELMKFLPGSIDEESTKEIYRNF